MRSGLCWRALLAESVPGWSAQVDEAADHRLDPVAVLGREPVAGRARAVRARPAPGSAPSTGAAFARSRRSATSTGMAMWTCRGPDLHARLYRCLGNGSGFASGIGVSSGWSGSTPVLQEGNGEVWNVVRMPRLFGGLRTEDQFG
jgi:hypothetical protein